MGKVVQTLPASVVGRVRDHRKHLITGGEGALGQQIASGLVSRGARAIIFLGRTGLASPRAAP